MKVIQRWRLSSQFLSVAAAAVVALPCVGEPPMNIPRVDPSKREIVEQPTSTVVRGSAAVTRPTTPMTQGVRAPDEGKRVIEAPTKTVLAAATAAIANPTVKPGDVRWHASFDEACRAAKASAKPVLLFHMMGQLDKQFC